MVDLISSALRKLKKQVYFSRLYLPPLNRSRGFTLLEIIVVLGIIGFLATVVGPRVMSSFDRSSFEKTKLNMSMIMEKIALYQSDCQKLPSDLKYLMEEDPDCKRWGPTPYMKPIPKDGWGRDFIYETDGVNYTVKSLGKDQKEGGKEINKDISSDDL